jgi:hypothetical protein
MLEEDKQDNRQLAIADESLVSSIRFSPFTAIRAVRYRTPCKKSAAKTVYLYYIMRRRHKLNSGAAPGM